VGDLLLQLEDVQGFGEEAFPLNILGSPVTRYLFGILGDHFRPVDNVQYKFAHGIQLPFMWRLLRIM
jgi:hypothetical protein